MRNKIRIWLLASRPRTLTASLSPVLIASALAYADGIFLLIPALLSFAVALFAQIASNFANDYFDYKKGADGEGRVGPQRMVSSGIISPRAMLMATFIALVIALIAGLGLLPYGGWRLISVGLAIAICVLAYSAGPFPLAYNGLGDVCVLLFYGVIPVVFTYYVQAGRFSYKALAFGLAIGFVATNLLLVNNYRDYAQDKGNNKRTTVVIFGRQFAIILYLANLVFSIVLVAPFFGMFGIFYIPFIVFGYLSWLQLRKLDGAALNIVLASAARNILIFALITSALLLTR